MARIKFYPPQSVFISFVLAAIAGNVSQLSAETKMSITVRDKATGEKVAARLQYTTPAAGGPKWKGVLESGSQKLFDGQATLFPKPGSFEFMLRRGPEFQEVRSGFTIDRNAEDAMELIIPHKTPMRLFGWFSGDLSAAIPADRLRRWSKAEDLDIVCTSVISLPEKQQSNINSKPATTNVDRKSEKSNTDEETLPLQRNFWEEKDWTLVPCPPSLGAVQSNSLSFNQPGIGGIHIAMTAELQKDAPEEFEVLRKASQSKAATEALEVLSKMPKERDFHLSISRPWEPLVPVVLAITHVDSIELLSHHLRPDSGDDIPKDILNPDSIRFRGKRGLGRLAEHFYWQLLQSGFKLPLTAGSGFDEKGKTYLGYNRTYVFLDETLPRTRESWWQQSKEGASFVTNGPLLQTSINGLRPGSIQKSYRGESIPLDIVIDLTTRDNVDYLDVIFNGKSLYQAKLEEHVQRGNFPAMSINESGWLVIRVVTAHEESYRMTTTSPYYFNFGSDFIDPSAIDFFISRLEDYEHGLKGSKEQIDQMSSWIERAKEFWKSKK